jgi:DNA-binding NarL/FixJ family response regulator
MNIRVLMADDHKIFLEGLRSLLSAEPQMEVVAEVDNGRSAVESALAIDPDVVLMDISMQELNGIEAARQICSERSDIRVLCLSMHADREFVDAALRAGASGYLLKDCEMDELVRAIRVVANGRVYLSPAVAGSVLEGYRNGGLRTESKAISVLSTREREVLQLLAEGHPTRDIAERLGVSVKTISTHRENLMQKLEIRSVAGLTKFAIREGLTSVAN